MKGKLAAAVLISALALGANAFAREGEKSVEGMLNYGTESFTHLGSQFGATVGFGYLFRDNLQARLDVSYLRSSKDQMEMNIAGTRVPVDLGVRYYYPLPKVDSNLSVFGSGGLEISFDDWETAPDLPSRSRTRVGAVLGAGGEYRLDRNFSAVGNLQYHIIDGSYLSAGLGISYRFGEGMASSSPASR